ncbi:hypothetical protein ACJX0J_004062 (mitochondrion) [Zea mays]
MGVIVPTVLKILTLALLRAKTAALFSSTSFFTFKEIAEKDGNMCYGSFLFFDLLRKWSFLSEQDYYIHQVLSIIKKTLKSKTQHFSHSSNVKITIESDEDQYRDAQQ